MPASTLSIASLALASIVLSSGCQGRGQLVLGFATDLPATGSLDQVKMAVTRRGESTPIISQSWNISGVPARDFRLPGSFNLYGDPGAAPVFDVDVQGLVGGKLVVERVSSLGIVDDTELFIRLGLVASCESLGCPNSLTCIEGQCKTPFVDPRALPRYDRFLVTNLACDSGTVYTDTSTHEPLPVSGACGDDQLCVEGTCLVDPATLPSVDPEPFVGGDSELFSANKPPGGFFTVGPLDAARFSATATLLDDGTTLVVGGNDHPALDGSATPVAGAAIYDPITASYRRIADPPFTLAAHTATRLSGGLVLFVGSAGGEPAAFFYDQTKGVFTTAPAPLTARSFHSATLLSTGKVLIFGGATALGSSGYTLAATAELYDPTSNSWRATAGKPMTPRVFHASVLQANGQPMFLGGMNADREPIPDVEIYDPAAEAFTAASTFLVQPRALHTATLLSNGTVLVVGGVQFTAGAASATAELFAPESASTATPAPPPFPRLGMNAVSLGSDRVLFVGGASSLSSTGLVAAGGAFLYDPSVAAAPFVSLSAPAVARVLAYAVPFTSGDVLVGGGGVATAMLGDAGDDTLPPADLSIACNPGVVGTCGTNQRCSILATVGYGPRLVAPVSTACVANGSLTPGASCTAATPTQPDGCQDGFFCVASPLGGGPTCQPLCTSDAACATDLGISGICGLVLNGLETMGVGLCFSACDPEEDSCPQIGNGTGMCRYTLHAGGMLDAQGMCLSGGTLAQDAACSRTSSSTECGSSLICEDGTCKYQCQMQVNCDSVVPGTTCTLVPYSATQANDVVNGYCTSNSDAGVPDLLQPS